MSISYGRLLEQFTDMAEQGAFGSEMKQLRAKYQSEPTTIRALLSMVRDFSEGLKDEDPELANIRLHATQVLLMAYSETKLSDPVLAWNFVNAFINDYPGIAGSSLMPRWASFANATLAFREVIPSGNRLLVWQNARELFNAYNGFLDGLFGYLILMWRARSGKRINPNVLNDRYGNKVNVLRALSGGEDGPFHLFFRLANPDIRNAIAHQSIWLDSDTGMVHYSYGTSTKIEAEISISTFAVLNMVASNIAQPYVIAMSTIMIMETGTITERAMVPDLLRRMVISSGNN